MPFLLFAKGVEVEIAFAFSTLQSKQRRWYKESGFCDFGMQFRPTGQCLFGSSLVRWELPWLGEKTCVLGGVLVWSESLKI